MKLKRLLSALLATIMVVSQLPVISFAADAIDVNGTMGGEESTVYWKHSAINTYADKNNYGAYAMPLNLTKLSNQANDVHKGKHAQFILPAEYFDAENKNNTYQSKSGQWIHKLEFFLDGHYHTKPADKAYTGGEGTSQYAALQELAASMKSNILLGKVTVSIGITTKAEYSSSSDFVTGLTTVFTGTPYIAPYDNVADGGTGSDNDWADVLVFELETPFYYEGSSTKGYNIVLDFVMGADPDNNKSNGFGNIRDAYKYGSQHAELGNFQYSNLTETSKLNSTKKRQIGIGNDGNLKTWLPRSRVTFSTNAISGNTPNVTVTPGNTTFTANGTEQYPDVTVYDNVNKKSLTAGTDYDISFSGAGTSPVAAGNYTMTLTFKNGYTGTKTVDFAINPAPDSSTTTIYVASDKNKTGSLASGGAYSMAVDLWGKANPGTHSQSMFPADFFDAANNSITLGSQSGKSITKLEFVLAGTNYSEGPVTGFNITVSLGMSDRTVASTEDGDGATRHQLVGVYNNASNYYIPDSELTPVYTGTPEIVYDSGLGKYVLVVEFNQSGGVFDYTDGTKAIIVDVVRNSKGTSLSTSGTYGFAYYTMSGSDASRRLSIGNDGLGKNFFPVTRFTFKAEKATVSYDPNEVLTASKDGSTPIRPTFKVYDNVDEATPELTEGVDYVVSFNTPDGNAPKTAGSYVMTITFINDYADVKDEIIEFTVREAFNVKVEIPSQAYTGSPLVPVVTVKRTSDDKILALGKDYTLTINNGNPCVDAGKYSVVVTELRTDGAAAAVQEGTFEITQKTIGGTVVVEKSFSVNDADVTVTQKKGSVQADLKYNYGDNRNIPIVINSELISRAQTIIPGPGWKVVPDMSDADFEKWHGDIWHGDSHKMPAAMVEEKLQSLTLYYKSESGNVLTGGNVTVKLMEVEFTGLYSDFEDTSAAVTVFSGDVVIEGNTIVLNFNTPYEYNGGNLLVDIEGYLTASDSATDITFRGVNYTSVLGANKTQLDAVYLTCGYNGKYSNSFIYDQSVFVPQMTFGYGSDTVDVDVKAKLDKTEMTYNGSAQAPTVTVTDNNIGKTVGTSNYVVKYYQGETEVTNPTNAGTYAVTVELCGNYYGTIDAGTFTIGKGALPEGEYEVTFIGWHVGQDHGDDPVLKYPSSVPADVTITYVYYDETGKTQLASRPTEVGTYKVGAIIAETDAYSGKEIKATFEITGHNQAKSISAVAATCTGTGLTEGKKCSVCDVITLEQTVVPAKGHTYGSPVVAFSDDGTTYTVTVTCSECEESIDGHSKTSEVMRSEQTGYTDPVDCQTPNTITYTASGEFEGVKYTKNKTVNGDQYGEHVWRYPTYTFTPNGKECTTESYCSVLGCRKMEKETVYTTPTVKIPATCTEMGTTTYTATFNVDWAETQTKDVVDIRATGHTYELKSVDFTGDGAGYYVTVICKHDEYTDTSSKINSGVRTTSGNCQTLSTTIYEAKGTYQKVSYEKIYEIPGTGYGPHNFDGAEVTYNFAEDGLTCTASRTCTIEGCGHVQTATATTITSAVKTAATCEGMGTTTYTAKFTEDWAETKTLDVVDIPALDHAWNSGEETLAPTCITGGVKTYTCQRDKTHTRTETIPALGHTPGEAVIEDYCEPDCEYEGDYYSVVYCTACHNEIDGSRELVTVPALGHTDAEPLDGHCDRCSMLMDVTLTVKENMQGIYTATINGNGTLKMNGNELFSLSGSGAIKLFGVLNEGTYTSTGNYTVKVTVNPTQQMVTVQVTMPDGTVLIRSTYKAVSGDTYIFTTEGVDKYNLTNVSVSYSDISAKEYTLVDTEPGLLNGGTIYNISTSFTDARIDRAFAWTSTYTSNMTVRYKLAASVADNWLYAADDKVVLAGSVSTEYFYKADISGLCPGTTYQYQIGVKDSENDWSETYTFTTGTDNTSSFTFAAIGDTQSHTWADAKLAQAVIAEVEKINPAFLLHTGDVVENNPKWDPNEWNLYFKALGMFGTSVPHFVASGNHDVWLSSSPANYLFNSHFNHPNNGVNLGDVNISNNGPLANMTDNSSETVYSFDYGEAHIIVLNTGAMDGTNDPKILEAQEQWLINDLNANKHAKWTILMFHQPVYHRLANSGYDTPALKDIIENPDYGVDLVIQGHSHLVTRTNPMKSGAIVTSADAYKDGDPGKINRNSGVVYITIGSTTTAHDDFTYESYTTNTKEMMLIAVPDNQQASYATFDVSANALKVTIKQLNGLVLDEFTISGTKSGVSHSEVDYEKEPTCTETGLKDGVKCSVCGDILVTPKIVPAKGHTWADATCTTPKTCSVCGATEGDALGHKDENSDHNCDLCGNKLSDCADNDKDHNCDTCGATVGEHEAAEGKHNCAYCGEALSECGDNDPVDHKCDICEKVLTKCVDENTDFKCDICGEVYVNAYTDAITVPGEYTAEIRVDGSTVRLVYTGNITFAKSADGKWSHWVGFKVTAPESIDMTKVSIKVKDTVYVMDEIKDGDNFAFLYFGMTGRTHEVASYQIDWNGDKTYDLTVLLDASTANLLDCGHVDENNDHICDGCKEVMSNCSDEENDGNHSCDICGKVIVNEENVIEHSFGDHISTNDGWMTATCTECGATDTKYDENYEGENVEVNVPVTDGDTEIETSISAEDFGKLAGGTEENKGKGLNFVSNMLNIFFDKKAIRTISQQAYPETTTISIVVEDLTAEDSTDRLVYDLSIALDGQKLSHTPFGGGYATVTIPLGRLTGKTVEVWHIEDGERMAKMESTCSNDYVTFTTNHFSEYEVVAVEETPAGVMVNFVNYTASGANQATIKIDETEVAYAQKTAVEALLGANGEFTVTCAKACVVLVKNGDTYDRVTATLVEGNTYKFKVTPETDMEIVVAIKGDANLDGVVNSTDAGIVKAVSLNKPVVLNAIPAMLVDINQDGFKNATDAGIIKALSLQKNVPLNW